MRRKGKVSGHGGRSGSPYTALDASLDGGNGKGKAGGTLAGAGGGGDFLERHERFVPWALFALALFTRFYRLREPPGA